MEERYVVFQRPDPSEGPICALLTLCTQLPPVAQQFPSVFSIIDVCQLFTSEGSHRMCLDDEDELFDLDAEFARGEEDGAVLWTETSP